ncbi:hypothetical protein [Bacillus sp. NPDC077027]
MGKRKSSPRLATAPHQMLLIKVCPLSKKLYTKNEQRRLIVSQKEYMVR